ncbi:MAG TPA: radical SAM protein [Stellaceae bacterium]|nr:radical SAM protein [Stellaceae bacterium]
MADIVLISPRFEPSYWGIDYALPFLDGTAILPVMALPLLAALTPAEHSVTLFDENVQEIDWERCQRADIVGVTGMIVQRQRIGEILAELKRRAIFTVLGGPWITVQPDDYPGLTDVIFIGEAEETWPQFLAEWSDGRHQARYEQTEKSDMAKVPAPRLDLLPMRKYLYGSLQVSRGCPFTCEFCDIIVVFGRRPRLKTIAQVIAELDGLVAAGKRDAFVVDDNLIGNKKAIKPILREIIAWQKRNGYPLTLTTEASIDLAEDDEMIALMVEANFESVFIGIESPNEDALRETKKIQNLSDRSGTVMEKVHRIQQAGLEVWCGMIVGFDSDNADVFAAQREFIRESRIALAMVNILFAIPRTPLHTRLGKEGRLVELDDMVVHAATTNVRPSRIGRRELCDGYVDLMRDLYAPEAYFSRVDALYFDAKLLPSSGRRRYLRHHPWRWFKSRGLATVETIFVFIQLMRLVPDPALRREYRRRLWNAVKRRPHISVLRAYCVKCALHFHYDRLIGQLRRESGALLPQVSEMPQTLLASAAAE